MQNHTNFRTSRFSTPQPNMDVSTYDFTIKVLKCTKCGLKVCNFSKFWVCFLYFKFTSIIFADK